MLIKNAEVFLEGEFLKKDIRCKESVITEIMDEIEQDSNEEVINAVGKKIIPGLIEIHSHGCVGEDFATSDELGIKKMLGFYASKGVLNVLATTVTESPELTKKALRTIQNRIETQVDTEDIASIIGIHMEGPFLSHNKRGAHDEQFLLELSRDLMEEWKKEAPGSIRMISVDPDLDIRGDFIEKYAKEMVVSLAHTECSYETAKMVIGKGANHVTHLFNAMNGLNHREPGIVGAVSDFPIYAELISDGVHIHPAVIRLIYKVAGERIVLVSDSMSATGMENGIYQLGGLDVYMKDGKATLKDGTIAGSSVDLYEMMKRAIQFGVPEEKAVLSATYLPAKSIGCEDSMGSIMIGRKANLVMVDTSWNIINVYKNGRKIN